MLRQLTIALLAASLSGPVFGQGLGDAAAREKERRARLKQKGPVKTYTDEDLEKQKHQGTSGTAATSSGTEGSSTDSGAAPSEPETGRGRSRGESEGPRRRSHDESETGRAAGAEPGSSDVSSDWEDRAQGIRDQITAAQKRIAALEARIAELQLDANPNSPDLLDPNRLQKREAEKAQAISDLEKAKAALAQAQADRQKLEDDARRSGVPARRIQ